MFYLYSQKGICIISCYIHKCTVYVHNVTENGRHSRTKIIHDLFYADELTFIWENEGEMQVFLDKLNHLAKSCEIKCIML